MKAYSEDLAFVHDAGFSNLARRASSTVLQTLRQHALRQGLVIDLGCGSGILARELTRSGYDVLGVDISSAMLRRARGRAPKARFIRGSLFRVKLPPCVAVTAIGECLNYQFDPKSIGLAQFFQRVYKALAPAGVFIFDVAGPSRAPAPAERHFQGKHWAILVRSEEDQRRRLLTRHMVVFRKMGRHWRRSLEEHKQKLFTPQSVRRELRKAGFKVRSSKGYGQGASYPGTEVFIASRDRH
ncbi:MAG TPA: class I SAM-dependent methyltransferase [Terriglobales bacterium]|nr:class I SAM-dependent methyltransferase [Terriglobales bacterium]